jgi:hypothetical protein
VELPQHLEQRYVGARVVDDPLGAVLDQELEQLQGLGCQCSQTTKTMLYALCRSAATPQKLSL